ncbi:MAG TPA: hypothetical protein VFW03_23000, partial [Gemmatimonadaceae bacterium]|nr:hypothetical protein [Gemmatimonadaceae bacterium]
NESAQHSVPHMRALIGRAAAGIPLAVLRFELDASLSGDELVHTSYFGNEDVRRLICAHITLAGARTPPKAGDDAADWVRSRKRAVAAMLDR